MQRFLWWVFLLFLTLLLRLVPLPTTLFVCLPSPLLSCLPPFAPPIGLFLRSYLSFPLQKFVAPFPFFDAFFFIPWFLIFLRPDFTQHLFSYVALSSAHYDCLFLPYSRFPFFSFALKPVHKIAPHSRPPSLLVLSPPSLTMPFSPPFSYCGVYRFPFLPSPQVKPSCAWFRFVL